jgi:uncharacterized membrane protein YcaP (DUF421 family)
VRFLYGHQRIDRIVEGAPDVLIENGAIQTERCRRELITERALEAAAHKQGFAKLADVDHAVLESGGTISFFAKTPAPDDARHRELLMRLDQLTARIEALNA